MKRIELLLKDPLYMEHIEKNVNLEEDEKYCKHDLRHMIDVARITYILILEHHDLDYFIREAKLSGKLAAKEVIYAAGLLHDIAKWKQYQTAQDHASIGAEIAHEILPRAFFNDNEVEVIARAIYEHRNISRDMSFLGERLYRADNLSRICFLCEDRHRCLKYQNKEIGHDMLAY
ncbi:MAG TPA: HD domain-containing protein [Syntrophothermus lipocalidus]|uniref:HD domain-containing protein n=1 Tax=Syntrophothermus sp. TaxID=2736299 RepID=UPI0017C082AD|nr:HD domain-containing protein [Syntrophothermus sp.]NSW82961.1 HD domain-containing protein [Syntrophothermus sp.]HHV76104.1 HD domain-containing protein [Syntrophothermus lipocalidus]HOV42982.1 HD domain-containing protein [Syntrophothermus lipocalidus]